MLIGGECEHALHLSIVKRTNRHGAQIQRDRLEQNILRRVPRFEMCIARRAVAVLDRQAFVFRRDHKIDCRNFYRLLFQCCNEQRLSQIAAQNILLQAVALNLGAVPIGAFDDRQVQQALALPSAYQPLYVIPVGHR